MYIPKAFRIEDKELLFDFMENQPFALLVSQSGGKSAATHLPLLLDRRKELLYGHLARGNTQWIDMADQEVLAIFQGPHHYISPSWYETDKAVPTWNYAAVHVYGSITLMHDGDEVFRMLNELVEKHEEEGSGYRLNASNHELALGLLNGIVGFKMKISKIEAQWKMSQNHSPARRQRVIDNLIRLDRDNARDVAEWMRKTLESQELQ